MKHKSWVHPLISTALSVILSIGAIGSLITGYDLPVEALWSIYLWCALFATVSAVLFQCRYGGRIIICLAVLLFCGLWKGEALWKQTQCLSFFISSHYHDVYGWPVLGLPVAIEVSLPLILWAALVAVGVNWHICRQKHIVFALLPAIVPLGICLLTNDIVPDTVYLYLLVLGFAALLITGWTRRKYPDQGMELLLRSFIPIAVSLALLFAWYPEKEYVFDPGKLQKEIAAWLEELRDSSGNGAANSVAEKINLQTLGPKSERSRAVMVVNAPVDGKLYLRGRDYDQYTGTGWEATWDRDEKFTSGTGLAGEMTIDTYSVLDVLYIPYYATKQVELVGGACYNEENLRQYSYSVSQTDSRNSRTPDSRYKSLPADTLAWAKALVERITDGTPYDSEKLLRIRNYVCNSADYDLTTDRMDTQYDDFARWFLEEGETGYCVHFATAATVLLRAAGISARYVEGYMVNGRSGEDVTVTSLDAHAWVEYYDWSSSAWRILDATPADPTGGGAEPTTTASETEPSTEDPSQTQPVSTSPKDPQQTLPESPSDPSGSTGPQDKGKEPFKIPEWLTTVFVCLVFAACIPLQGYLRIRRKRCLWNRGRPNQRTITRWGQTQQLAKLLKQPYPEELEALAQKAKFSQHRILPAELRQFEIYRQSLIEQVHSLPWYYRIVFKWILAIG